MFIPIPIGADLKVTLQKNILKVITCEQCQEQYAYGVHLEATGKQFSPLFLDMHQCADGAVRQAEETLLKMGSNIVRPIPCPNCGFYQEEMIRRLKEDGHGNKLILVGLAVIAVSLIPLAFAIPNIWVLTAFGSTIGVALIGYADASASFLDPNSSDPEKRKELGRQNALWGESLSELLATHSQDQLESQITYKEV